MFLRQSILRACTRGQPLHQQRERHITSLFSFAKNKIAGAQADFSDAYRTHKNSMVTELTEERDSVYLREILKTNRKPLPVQTLLIEEKNAKPMADFAGLSLEGKDCSLHAAMEETPSDVTLVAFHFSQATMETANMFVDDFFTEFKDNPRVSTYQFSFLSGVWRLPMLRKLLTQWTGKVYPVERHSTVVNLFELFTHERKKIGILNRFSSFVFLLDARGRVRWRSSGKPFSLREIKTQTEAARLMQMETALKSPIKTPDHQDFFDTLAPLIRGGNLRNQSRLKTLKVDDKNGKCEKERQQQKQREAEEEVKDDNTLKMSVLQAKDDEEAFLIQENLRRQAAQKNKEMERKEYRAEHKKTFTDVVFVDTERKLLRAAIKKKYTERYHTESNARHSELEMLRAFTHTLLEEGEHRRRHQEKEGGNDSKTPNNNRQRHNKHRKNKKHAKR